MQWLYCATISAFQNFLFLQSIRIMVKDSGGAQWENNCGSQPKPFVLTRTCAREVVKWMPVSMDQLFFHSLLRLGCQLISSELEDPNGTFLVLYTLTSRRWLNSRLEVIHSELLFGSWGLLVRHARSRCRPCPQTKPWLHHYVADILPW